MARVLKSNTGKSSPSRRPAKRSAGVRKVAVARMGRKPVPENETRQERFIRIATKRMNNAIRQIQLLGNLCGPNYECGPDDLASMRDAILRELDMAIARFSPKRRQATGEAFTFGAENKAQVTNTQH